VVLYITNQPGFNPLKITTNNSSPNIILIVIDALRAKELNSERNKSRLKNLNRIIKRSAVFNNAYCCWNTTDASVTSIFSGLYPVSHGIVNHGDRIKKEYINTLNRVNPEFLTETLKKDGYETIGIDWLGRWFKKGFDFYEESLLKTPSNDSFIVDMKKYAVYLLRWAAIVQCYTQRRPKLNLKYILSEIKGVYTAFRFSKEIAKIQNGELAVNIAIDRIKKRQKDNFFTFIHFWDTHAPYHCPKPYKNYKGFNIKEYLKDKYYGSIDYVDDQLGRLLDFLEKDNLDKNTIMIITGDHGESLTEHDIFFDHHGLYEETVHVPLIFYYPEMFGKTEHVNGFVQHVDLVPTILEIIGIEYDQKLYDGVNLLPLINGEKERLRQYVYFEESYIQRKQGIRTDKYKYLTACDETNGYCRYCSKVHSGPEELYDLENDPGEKKNIVKEHSAEAEMLKEQLNSIIDDLNFKRSERIKNRLNKKQYIPVSEDEEQLKKRMQVLGYLD
jgi:arylsulfatase